MQAHEWLSSRMMFGIKVGLDQIQLILKRLGNPERNFPCIHVVGTNGKGSTSYWTQRILMAHGQKVGLFTSPHLVSVRERIRINDTPISNADFSYWLTKVQENSEGIEATYFEVLTAVAFAWFAANKVDSVVLEAGLGGRLDSTNVVHAKVVMLTSIGLDHTEILGNTEGQILQEKLGVVHNDATLVHRITDISLLQTLNALVQEKQANAIDAKEVWSQNLPVPYEGEVYQENARIAWVGAQKFLDKAYVAEHASKALQGAVWAGRQQIMGNFMLDGCHNGHAANKLAESLQKISGSKKYVIVVAVLSTKDPLEIIRPLLPFAQTIIFTKTAHPKMRNPQDYAANILQNESVNYLIENDIQKALLLAKEQSKNESTTILCTGSLYFVGAVVQLLKYEFSELQWFRQFEPDDNELK